MKNLRFVLSLMVCITCAVPSSARVLDDRKNEIAVLPRKPVRSSNIASIGYDAASLTLEVEFINGAVYQYYNVPQSVYQNLMSAQSHGGYLADHVKDAGYRYERVQ